MSLEERITAAAADRERDERPDGPVVPRQRRDAYDAYAEVTNTAARPTPSSRIC